MNTKQWHRCACTFEKVKTSDHAAKDAFENHLHHYETMRTISGGYLSKLECSVQKAVNQILPELKLRTQVLLSKKELNELPNDSKNIFIKSNIDRYINQPNVLFSVGKIIFVMLNSIINQIIHLIISQMNFKTN